MRANTLVLLNTADGADSGDMSGNLAFGLTQPTPGAALGPVKLAQIFGYSIQANYLTGSPTGELKLQASNDGINFCDIPGTPVTISGVGSFLWNITSSNYLYVQLVWTKSGSPTGTLKALAYVRGF